MALFHKLPYQLPKHLQSSHAVNTRKRCQNTQIARRNFVIRVQLSSFIFLFPCFCAVLPLLQQHGKRLPFPGVRLQNGRTTWQHRNTIDERVVLSKSTHFTLSFVYSLVYASLVMRKFQIGAKSYSLSFRQNDLSDAITPGP